MHRVTLIPGDWIGPECCKTVQRVIAAAGVNIDWDVQPIVDGQITDQLILSCQQSGVVLKAKVKSPTEVGKLPPTIQLRKALGLWASVRPVKALAGVDAKCKNIDLVVIRETSEDIYSGFEHEVTEGVYEAVKVTTPSACERILRYAYEYASENDRKQVTIAHKSNIMKKSDGLFLRLSREVAAEYPQIETKEVIVDALCMQLVRWADYFDVLVTLNLFGDIISDLCSGLAGGITASPSASFGNNIAVFENLHGNAPDLVGTDQANPIPMLNSALMMLDHLGEDVAASRIRSAINRVVGNGVKTREMGGLSSCSEVTEAIISAL